MVPTLQAITYSWHKENLRELYLNLLSSSMDKTVENSVHLSYVDIIKQLSPTDALVFKKYLIIREWSQCL